MTRRTKDPQDKRNIQVRMSVTPGEKAAIDLLATEYGYSGASDALRRSLALLIATKHNELQKYLRNDLTK